MYYDRQGHLLTAAEFSKLFAKEEYRVVSKTILPSGVVVSTVWLGIDHAFGKQYTPVIFETMVFDEKDNSVDCRRYSTEEDARRGHQQAVGAWGILLS